MSSEPRMTPSQIVREIADYADGDSWPNSEAAALRQCAEEFDENIELRYRLSDANQQLDVLRPGGTYAWKCRAEAAEAQLQTREAAITELESALLSLFYLIDPNDITPEGLAEVKALLVRRLRIPEVPK